MTGPDATTGPDAVLEVTGVTHRLRDGGGRGSAAAEAVLTDVDLRVGPARTVALAGRSGSGKSTLCHLVAGLGVPSSGRIAVDGRPAHEVDDWAVVALLPQRLALVPELTVAENVGLPLTLRGRGGDTGAVTAPLLEALGLTGVSGQLVGRTSLGEQQRAGVARALVLGPRLVVLDEPTGHQDDGNVSLVLAALGAARERGTSALVATHDERVLDVADAVVHLHQGRVVSGP